MKVLSLACNNCGAPLDVPPRTRFLNCAYCDTRLEVKHEGNAVYTDALDQIAGRTERIADDVAAIRLQNELDQLDREWLLDRQRYLVTDKRGNQHVPNAIFVVFFMIIWLVVGGFVTAGFAAAGGPLALLPAAMVAFGIFGMLSSLKKAHEFENHRREYQQRRRQLLGRLRDESASEEIG